MRLGYLGGALATLLLLVGPAGAQHHTSLVVAPDDITWAPPAPNGVRRAVLEGNPDLPGPFTMRVSLPPNWRIAPHTHAATEYLTVMSGTLYVGHGERFDAAEMKVLTAGGFVMMQPGMPHFLMVREQTVIQVQSMGPLVITYVNPADDPRKK
jgi:quercetin dioxygenase-like cupin family protein